MAPEQLFVPAYVPDTEDVETPAAVPSSVTLHPGNPAMPPAGTAIVNVKDVLVRLPVTLPLKATVPAAVDAATDPDTELPDWASVHVINPLPVESDAVPA
jgi:hypothetical protein